MWWLSFWFNQQVVIIHWSHLKGTFKVSTSQHALFSSYFFIVCKQNLPDILNFCSFYLFFLFNEAEYSSNAHDVALFFYFHAAVHCRCKVLIYSRRRLMLKVRIYWQHYKKSLASKKCYFVNNYFLSQYITFFWEKINFYITLDHFFYFTIWWLFTRVFIYFKDKESPRAKIQKCLKKSAFQTNSHRVP